MCARKKDWSSARAVAAIAHDKHGRLAHWQHMHVLGRKAFRAEATREIFRHRRRLPARDGRIHLNDGFENLARRGARARIVRLRVRC